MKTWDTVAIVGVGLIGASVGLALRERKLAREVVGIGRRSSTLRVARRRGAVTRTTLDLADGVAHAELTVVCTPVEQIAEHVRAAAGSCPRGALITDAGSTKSEIVSSLDEALERHNPRQAMYVGSHPMAGSEQSGPQNARPDLFEGCVTIMTPSEKTPSKTYQSVSRFWRALGAKVIRMVPREHDLAVAQISHLPHVVAAALAAVTPAERLPIAAGGWRDTTRIAEGMPLLWRQILSQNRFNVLQALEAFCQELSEFRKALTYDDHDRLEQLLSKGMEIRRQARHRG
jgi:prephenate dehydrogenase